jgi:hypothetical protein
MTPDQERNFNWTDWFEKQETGGWPPVPEATEAMVANGLLIEDIQKAWIDGKLMYRQQGETVAAFEKRCRNFISMTMSPPDKQQVMVRVQHEGDPPHVFPVSDLNLTGKKIAEPSGQEWIEIAYEEWQCDRQTDRYSWVTRYVSDFQVSRENGIAICQMIVRNMLDHASGDSVKDAVLMGYIADAFPRFTYPLQIGCRRLKIFKIEAVKGQADGA